MKKILKRTALVLGALVLLGAGVMLYMIGPSNVWGMLRYDQRQEGNLAVGMPAPDIELVALDGTTREHLASRVGAKPLVLIFGSYT